MVNLLLQEPRSLLSDLAERFASFAPFAPLRVIFDRKSIRVEHEMKEDHYEVRAELPGLDPAEDVDITVSDGHLVIQAERTQQAETTARSEFCYGSFVRAVALPDGADAEDIKATYSRGILTVSVPVPESQIDVETVDEPVAVPVRVPSEDDASPEGE
jgi:HSP20 family protein